MYGINDFLEIVFMEYAKKYIHKECTHTAVQMILIAESYLFGAYETEVKGW